MVPGARTEPQEAKALFQIAAGRARDRVHAQWIHNAATEEGAFGSTKFVRPTSEDLVSKSTHEEEKTDAKRAGFVFLLVKNNNNNKGGNRKEQLSIQTNKSKLNNSYSIKLTPVVFVSAHVSSFKYWKGLIKHRGKSVNSVMLAKYYDPECWIINYSARNLQSISVLNCLL